MALVVISINEDELPPHTKEEFEEWVRFCVGDRGGIPMANPLHEYDMTATVREVSSTGR